MSKRLLFCVAILGCHKSQPEAQAPVAPRETTAVAPAPAPTPPPSPTANARLAPPQRWEQIGYRGEARERVVMGSIVWRGGEAFEVDLMGAMKEMMHEQITEAINAKPDDPGAAIQGVIDHMNEMMGASKIMEWVRVK